LGAAREDWNLERLDLALQLTDFDRLPAPVD